MAGITVRLLQESDDASAAGHVVQSTYLQLPGYPRDDEYDRSLAAVAERAARSGVVIALDADEIVACLTYVADHTDPAHEFADQDSASFRFFAVSPAAQGKGVGKAMVDWCIARARADGKSRIRIHTLESMPAAQRLYERIGFRRDPATDEIWDGIKGIAYVFEC